MTGERPITRETAAVHAGPLPGRVDVAIVGGGAIGVFAALFLAREGVSVAVFEKGVVAGEQSSRNWGWIRQQGRDEAELPIMMEANRLWREVDAELGGATGLKECGVLYIASSEGELRKLEEWLPVARRHGLDTRMLGRAELDALVDRRGSNAPRHEWVGAMHTPGDLRAEPWKAIPAVAGLAARSGAIIRERCAVRLIETRNGAVSGVVTEAGRVACHAVIVAGGAWSSLLLRRHGIAIPQLAVKSIVARTAPMPEVFGGCAVDADDLEKRFAGRGRTPPRTPHAAVLCATRRQYVAELEPLEPAIGRTNGIYWAPTRTVWFFDEPAAVVTGEEHAGGGLEAFTIHHEATHQLFAEARPPAPAAAAAAGAGERCGFWAVEAVACYMETLAPMPHGWTVGGLDAGRVPAARQRLLEEGDYVPLAELAALGRAALQADDRLTWIYSQAAGLADFLMNGRGGRYREAFLAYLARVYAGTADADTLARLCGRTYAELDEEYRRHLAR